MIIIMRPTATEREIQALAKHLVDREMTVQRNDGVDCTVLGVIGNVELLDPSSFTLRPGVDRVMSVSEPYKKANRKFHPDDTIVKVGKVEVGGQHFALVAGPCSVESPEQVTLIAKAVKDAGACMLRGGAFKPRTSPYAFQGMEAKGIEWLCQAREETGLPVVSELMSETHIDLFERAVDVIQIGARNMQNFDLLKAVGAMRKPILLKRGMSSTIEEWLMSAEYIMARGNQNVILCERGIRTFENYTRNTLDLSAIPAIKKLSHLPVVVDPSHATGKSWMVPSMAMAAMAAGADGLVIEVHNDPVRAMCDGAQSLTCEQFADLTRKLERLAPALGRTL